MTDDKMPVFSHGPWLLEETGQRFTGNQLDAAAFAKYRAALAECQERCNETIAMCEQLRAQVEALRAYRVLRQAVDAMMAPLGYHGTISARDDRVQAVMDALAQIDQDERE